jgi:hypothetical protein
VFASISKVSSSKGRTVYIGLILANASIFEKYSFKDVISGA